MSACGQMIKKLRKERGYTQRELAEKIGVSFQAISKWETGAAYPDIEMLPVITRLLHTSADVLLGNITGEYQNTVYQDKYKDEGYYWGLTPSAICYKILEKYPPARKLSLLEIGCGEGRDALFFARNGYDVTAFDIAESGIKKVIELSALYNVAINAFRADMLTYEIKKSYDIIYSSRALHYISPPLRPMIIEQIKEHTVKGGVNIFDVFVDKPFVEPSPDREKNVFLWHSGELFGYYKDWELEYIDERIYPCDSSGVLHRHASNLMFAKKV